MKDDDFENLSVAMKDLRDAIVAPFIPLLDKLEKWLEEKGKQ